LIAHVVGSPNTAATLTLTTFGPGLSVRLTRLHIYRVATLAVTATALLTISTTNLPSALQWDVANGVSAFSKTLDIDLSFPEGIVAALPETDVVITLPAPGLGVSWRGLAVYSMVR